MTPEAIEIFHCSDVHFGHPAVPEQYEMIETLIQERKFDVVVISGDLTQRCRSGEGSLAPAAFVDQGREVGAEGLIEQQALQELERATGPDYAPAVEDLHGMPGG